MSQRLLTTLSGPLAQTGVVGLWGASSWVKSVQSGYISNSAEAPTTVTINAVVPENSLLIHQGFNQSGNQQQVYWSCHIVLTNATTITLTRAASGGSAAGIAWTVIELIPGVIKSVQQGVLTIPSGLATATATVAQFDPKKSMVFHLGTVINGSGSNSGDWQTRVTAVATGLGIAADRFGILEAASVSWRLVEFF